MSRLSPRPEGPDFKTVIPGKSLTKQSLGEETDINYIVAKFISSGSLDAFNRREARYGDVSGVGDYMECLNRVLSAEDAFNSLPAEVRAHCQNDVVNFLELVHDPTRVEELRALGLLPPGETPPAPAGSSSAEGPDAPDESAQSNT